MYQTFPLNPELVYTEKAKYDTAKTEFESGDIQLRAKAERGRRYWKLVWATAPRSEYDIFRSFHRDHLGSATPFYFNPADACADPYCPPDVSSEAGGTLDEHTVYAAYTWCDSEGAETKPSQAGALIVAVNRLATVTVPYFPPNVAYANVYVGPASGTLYKQSGAIATSGGTWTEPSGGYSESGDPTPTENTLDEDVFVHFLSDEFEQSRVTPNTWAFDCELEELFE